MQTRHSQNVLIATVAQAIRAENSFLYKTKFTVKRNSALVVSKNGQFNTHNRSPAVGVVDEKK